jgi:hypothetical protein
MRCLILQAALGTLALAFTAGTYTPLKLSDNPQINLNRPGSYRATVEVVKHLDLFTTRFRVVDTGVIFNGEQEFTLTQRLGNHQSACKYVALITLGGLTPIVKQIEKLPDGDCPK